MRARWQHLLYELWGRIDQPGMYDHLTARVIRRVVAPSSVAVDVGANEGSILRLLVRRAHAGHLYAFEPLPAHAERLRSRYREQKHIEIHQAALGAVDGEMPFYEVTSSPGYSGLSPRDLAATRGAQIRELRCRVVRLDDVIPVDQQVDFIKIDVEGAERLVFEGAMGVIRRCRPVIVFEHGQGGANFFDTRPENIFDLLVEDADLRISLLPDYLAGRAALDRAALVHHYTARLNSYYVAHPPRRAR